MTTISHISTVADNQSNIPVNTTTFLVSSVAAVANDAILLEICYYKDATKTLTAPLWGAQAFTQIGSNYDGVEHIVQLWALQVASSATSNITATITPTITDFLTLNATATVLRPSGVATLSFSALTQQKYNSGTFAAPSLTGTSIPASAMLVSYLNAMGWDSGFSDVTATTWTPGASTTVRGSVQNTLRKNVNWTYVATAPGAGSNIIASWAQSASQNPQYSHTILYVDSAVASSLDTLTSPVAVGSTGNSGTTTGMGAITTLTFAGKSATVTSASVGTFGWSMPTFSHGVTYPAMGSQTFTAGDGSGTNTKASTVTTMASYTAVTMAGTLDTGDFSIAKDPAIVVGDVIHLPTAAGTLNANGTLTDYVFGVYTMWRWEAATGIMYTSQLTVSSSGLNIANKKRWIGLGIGI